MSTGTFTIPVSAAPRAEYLPETRGCHVDISRHTTPDTLRRSITRIARAGFNVALFPVYIGGDTLFPCEASQSIFAGDRRKRFRTIHPAFRKWDPLGVAIETAHGFGVHVWGFVRPYNFHPRYGITAQRLLRKFPDWRIQIHPAYRSSERRHRGSYIACPVNHDYRRYLADLLTEVVSAYAIDGLVLNFTGFGLRRGPMELHPFCFCSHCSARYREQADGSLMQDARSEEGLAKVRQWEVGASAHAIDYIRHRVIKSRRTLRFIARTHPQWRWNMDDSGPLIQAPLAIDWNALLHSGQVEELLIDHDDETAPEVFSTRLVSDLANLHDEALLLPSVEVTKPQDLAEPLAAVRKHPVAGIMAEFDKPLSDEDADFIHANYLSEPAQSPDHSPLLAVAYLLHRIQASHQDNPLIADFMRDFLRVIEMQLRRGASFAWLEILFQNLTGLQDSIRRGRLEGYHVPEGALRDLGLARRIIRIACLDVRS